MVFTCGATEISVAGSVIAPVTSVDKMVAVFALNFKGKRGKQTPEKLEGGTPDTPSFLDPTAEPASLQASDSMVNQENLEIKAVE